MINARPSFIALAAVSLAFACNGNPPEPVTGPDCKVPASDSGCALTLICELSDGATVSGINTDGASFQCEAPTVCSKTGGAGPIELTCAGGAVPDPSLKCLNLSSPKGGPSFYCCPCMQQGN
jgi:hypothetical protein